MRLFTIILSGFLIACQPKNNGAPDRNFYFEVIALDNDEASLRLAQYLKEQIPAKKYTITNHSGLTWPFYRELDPKEKISRDSLMPPHWFVHKMILLKDQQIGRDEFLVKIRVFPHQDTVPNYSVDIFRMDSTGLSLSGQTGVHYIDSTEFSSENSLREFFLKSIIRYSFK